MSEVTTLRKLRASNAKLMKGNSALLMSIREVDSEIGREWLQLQQYTAFLQDKQIALPPSCAELMGITEPDSAPDDNEANRPMAHEGPRSSSSPADPQPEHQTTKPKPASALSVRSVLNDDLSESSDSNNSSADAS